MLAANHIYGVFSVASGVEFSLDSRNETIRGGVILGSAGKTRQMVSPETESRQPK